MSRILYLDASFERPFIAYEGKLLELGSSDLLAGAIAILGPFDAIAAGGGPGSYTGIRSALALASGLSLASGAPLIMLSALYGLVPSEEGRFQAMLDARSGGVYYLAGSKGDKVVFDEKPLKKSLEELIVEKMIVSPHAALLQTRLKQRADGADGVHFIDKMPDPELLLQAAQDKLDAGLYSLDGYGELLYLGKQL